MPRKQRATVAQIASALTDGGKDLAAEIDRSIKAARAQRDKILADAQRCAAEIEARITVLVEARDQLRPRHGKDGRTAQELDPHKIAGRGNLTEIEQYLVSHRIATQHQVAEALGKNSGTVTWAMRALEQDGKVKPTGRKINGSPEWSIREEAPNPTLAY